MQRCPDTRLLVCPQLAMNGRLMQLLRRAFMQHGLGGREALGLGICPSRRTAAFVSAACGTSKTACGSGTFCMALRRLPFDASYRWPVPDKRARSRRDGTEDLAALFVRRNVRTLWLCTRSD